MGNGLKEADINLKVSWRLARLLNREGIHVIMTRPFENALAPKVDSKERTIRCKLANNAKALRFISIHCNSATNPNATGHEVLHHPNSTKGKKLAENINKSIAKHFPNLRNRGVKADERGIQVLKQTSMPAALVELAFISNPNDAALLSNDEALDRMAQAICDGILEDIKDE